MQRQIIKIDEELCTGCGECVLACAEGAIRIIDGKAKLVSEVYCDGLGACLGECPEGALTIETREAEEFDEEATAKYLENQKPDAETSAAKNPHEEPCGCPGTALRSFAAHAGSGCPGSALREMDRAPENSDDAPCDLPSHLSHWPVQLMLVPPQAPFLKNADLLICADCVPFALPDFHSKWLKGRKVLVGCPKLDDLDFYREKLKEIFAIAKPKSVTVLKMEVPCCGGIAFAVHEAIKAVNPDIPLEIHTIGIQGDEITQTLPGLTTMPKGATL